MDRHHFGPASSHTVGQYLVQVYLLLREGNRVVGARLAERMKVSPPAVTQALRRLARDGLITLDRKAGVQFTASGRDIAEITLRRHYLIERLLVDLLGLSWATVHEEADRLEHFLSPDLEKHIYERLGHPTTCPHGNPMPGSPDEKRLIQARSLAQAIEGERVTILRVTEEAEEDLGLMAFLLEHGMLPGSKFTVGAGVSAEGHVALQGDTGRASVPLAYAQQVRISEPVAR